MKRAGLTMLIALSASLMSACGEMPQEVPYQNGHYAGKPDTPNWAGEAFDGNRENWEREIKRRNKLQSEYSRPGGG